MTSTSLDANVVLRMILNDVPEQADRAAEFLERHACYLTDVVVSECVFVLEKVYKLDRLFIKGSMEILFEIETVNFNESLIEEAFDLYVAHKALSFADCYSAAEAALGQNELLTFDRAIIKKCSTVAKEPQ